MTPPESLTPTVSKNLAMTQEERSHLEHSIFWNAIGGAIFIIIWVVAVIAILSARNSPSAAPPIVLFGILLFFTLGAGFRAYPRIRQTYVIWQDIRNSQVQLDVGTVIPQVIALGRNVKMVLVVDGNRTYSALDPVLRSIQNSVTPENPTGDRFCLRIAPCSRIVVNAVSVGSQSV